MLLRGKPQALNRVPSNLPVSARTQNLVSLTVAVAAVHAATECCERYRSQLNNASTEVAESLIYAEGHHPPPTYMLGVYIFLKNNKISLWGSMGQ